MINVLFNLETHIPKHIQGQALVDTLYKLIDLAESHGFIHHSFEYAPAEDTTVFFITEKTTGADRVGGYTDFDVVDINTLLVLLQTT